MDRKLNREYRGGDVLRYLVGRATIGRAEAVRQFGIENVALLALLRSQLCQMFYWAGENSSDTILTGERIPRAIDFESMHNYLKPNAILCLGGGPAISAIIFLTMARPNDRKSCATMTNEPGPAITLSR